MSSDRIAVKVDEDLGLVAYHDPFRKEWIELCKVRIFFIAKKRSADTLFLSLCKELAATFALANHVSVGLEHCF